MSSWFYKQLRRKAVSQQKPPPPPPPCSPNRASYYIPSRCRHRAHSPRAKQPGDIVFDVVPRFDDDAMMMHELKLRPILTKPATRGEASAPPTARVRLHARRKPPEESCRRRWLYESVVLVKESAEPEEDFLASMREMIAANRDVRSLHDLLACYLALNAADHHRAIVAAFHRACIDSVLPPPRERLA